MLLAAIFSTRVRHRQAKQLAISVSRWCHSYTPSHVPVVIVGAGPTGLVLSCFLSQYGIRHMVLERSNQLTQHPQAHYINNRTMEVFRTIPGLSKQVAASSPPLQQWRKFIYCEGMAEGQILGEVDHFPGAISPHDPAVSPEPVTHLSQHRLLPLLLQHAQQLSAANGNCADIRFGHSVTAISNVEFPHKAQPPRTQHYAANIQQSATAQDPIAPQAQQQQQQRVLSEDLAAQQYPVCVAVESAGGRDTQLVRCSYLAAADGANSNIRNLLGIRMSGDAALQHLMSIHFSWLDLGHQLLAAGREAMLYFVFNRQLVGVVVAHDLEKGEFVAQVPYYPPLQSPTDFTADVCQQLIAAAAGWPLYRLQQQKHQTHSASSSSKFKLHSVKSWVMSALVADEYDAWAHRVFLVGDAAHRFPPAGGFGMNTGVQDAHNLAWKLAVVLSGTASHTLLQSYQLERQPVATSNTKLSVSNWQEAIRVPQALGLDPSAATLVNNLISAAPVPAAFSRLLLDSALSAGRSLAAAVTPFRKAALEDILRSGLSLRLQFPKEDLGFVYSEGAVAAQQSQQASTGSSSSGVSNRSSPYVPSTVVGGRLPHCRLLLLDATRGGDSEEVSSLDFVTPCRLGVNMLLICYSRNNSPSDNPHKSSEGTGAAAAADQDDDHDWWSAGRQLQQEGWPLTLLQLLPQHIAHDVSGAAGLAVSNSNQTVDTDQHSKQQQQRSAAVLQAVDVDGSWAALHRGCSSVAVLVRPDGHVAWTSQRSHQVAQQQPRSFKDDVSPEESQSTDHGAASELRSVLRDVLHLQVPDGQYDTW